MARLSSVFIVFLFLLAMPGKTYAADQNDKYLIKGYGAKSCGSYIQHRKEPNLEADILFWVGGYITAYNVLKAETYSIMGSTDIDGVMGWLDNYCRANPLERFSTAIYLLTIKLYPKRQKEAP